MRFVVDASNFRRGRRCRRRRGRLPRRPRRRRRFPRRASSSSDRAGRAAHPLPLSHPSPPEPSEPELGQPQRWVRGVRRPIFVWSSIRSRRGRSAFHLRRRNAPSESRRARNVRGAVSVREEEHHVGERRHLFGGRSARRGPCHCVFEPGNGMRNWDPGIAERGKRAPGPAASESEAAPRDAAAAAAAARRRASPPPPPSIAAYTSAAAAASPVGRRGLCTSAGAFVGPGSTIAAGVRVRAPRGRHRHAALAAKNCCACAACAASAPPAASPTPTPTPSAPTPSDC